MLPTSSNTNALLDIYFLVIPAASVVVEHRLQVGVVPLVARPLVVNSVRKKSVETETNQERLAHLHPTLRTSELE